MTLETEVYRVRARGKAARTKPMDDEKEEVSMTAPTPTGRFVGNDLHLVRKFRAPIEDVWKSFTDPESTARWFGPWRWVDKVGPGNEIAYTMIQEEGAPESTAVVERCEPRAISRSPATVHTECRTRSLSRRQQARPL